MLLRGCLAAVAVVLLASAWSIFRFLIPRAWQKGGLRHLAPIAYIALLLGLVVLVIALPRRLRLAAGLAVALSVILFVSLWPAWEASSFPYAIDLGQLVAAARPDGLGRLRLCVYATSGPVWLADVGNGADTPVVRGRVTGFYVEHPSLYTRAVVVSWGFTLRPVWPGSVRGAR